MDKRHKEALDYAVNSIKNNDISHYIDDIILYGSCARNSERYGSDIDLFLVFNTEFESVEGKNRINNKIRNESSPNELDSVEIDIHYAIGNEWRNSKRAYYSNIKREGISVWK